MGDVESGGEELDDVHLFGEDSDDGEEEDVWGECAISITCTTCFIRVSQVRSALSGSI